MIEKVVVGVGEDRLAIECGQRRFDLRPGGNCKGCRKGAAQHGLSEKIRHGGLHLRSKQGDSASTLPALDAGSGGSIALTRCLSCAMPVRFNSVNHFSSERTSRGF